MNIKKKKIIIAIAVLLIAGGSYWWYSQSKTGDKQVQYVTAAAEKGMLAVSVSGSGQVEAVSQVDLKPVVAGDAIDVIEVYVKNDQAVKKGELIALLDSADAEKAIRDAELSLRSAEIKMKQTKKLNDSQAEDDRLVRQTQEISVSQSVNRLADAKEKLRDYYIRAPFDGIVTGLSVSAGDSVSRSDIIATVITKDVHAEVVLNEIDAAQVKVGDKTILKFDALPETSITGQITKIDTIGTVSQGVVSYNAEISFDLQNNLLKPGMSVSSSIITDTKADILMVPLSAVKTEGSNNYVEILVDNIPQRINVQAGVSNNEFTEISGDIKAGNEVITQTIDPNTTTTPVSSGGGFGGGGAFRALH